MLAVRTLRPLPPEGPLTQPGLEQLQEPGLHVVHAPSAYILSEEIAAVMGDEVAWLRLSRLDRNPACLAGALAERYPAARETLLGLDTPSLLGGAIQSHLSPETPFVIENVNGRLSADTGLEFARALHRAGQLRVTVVSHSKLPRMVAPKSLHALTRRDLVLEPSTTSTTLERAVASLGVPMVARFLKLANGRAALVKDALEAVSACEPRPFVTAVSTCWRTGSLAKSLSLAYLNRCSAVELEALTVANELGYWSAQIGPNIDPNMLRPWLAPLAEDWYWIRPLWRPLLAQQLAEVAPAQTTTRPRRPDSLRPDDLEAAPRGAMDPPVARAAAPIPVAEPAVIRRPVESTHALADPASSSANDGRLELTVRLLGTFEVAIDGELVDSWEGRLAPRILSFLITRPERYAPRDRLIETFWPDADPRRGRNRLHVALSALRRSLRSNTDVDVIAFNNGGYVIDPNVELRVDVEEFESALSRAQQHDRSGDGSAALALYMAALQSYRGTFLADNPYEEWTIVLRETITSKYIDALSRTAHLLEAAGRDDECISVAHRMLEQDACLEEAHRLLIRSFARQGQEHRAIRQFEVCQRILEHQTSRTASPETVQEYLRVRRGLAASRSRERGSVG